MFVSVKQELLEDYRVRLVQLRKEFAPNTPQYLAILNTAHYIISVLNEWVEKPVSVCNLLVNLCNLLAKCVMYL